MTRLKVSGFLSHPCTVKVFRGNQFLGYRWQPAAGKFTLVFDSEGIDGISVVCEREDGRVQGYGNIEPVPTKEPVNVTLPENAMIQAPAGTLLPWIGGYFTNSSNSGYVPILGQSVPEINRQINQHGWHVCDGSELNDPESAIFNGPGRHLPNISAPVTAQKKQKRVLTLNGPHKASKESFLQLDARHHHELPQEDPLGLAQLSCVFILKVR